MTAPLSNQWHLTRYYHYVNPKQPGDPTGDHILVHLIHPLIRSLKEKELIRHAAFMRFSEGGSHTRLRLLTDTTLHSACEEQIEAAIATYHATYPDVNQGEMSISPIGQIINQKWTRDTNSINHRTLQPPRSYQMGTSQANETHLKLIYESDAIFLADAALQDLICDVWLTFLARQPSLQERKVFLRLFLLDVFRLFDVTEYDMYRIVYYLQSEWIDYFRLAPYIQPYFDQYESSRDRYNAYLTRFYEVGAEAMLPAAWRPLYMDAIQQVQALITERDIIRHEADGTTLTPFSMMRLFSFFHLNHNRLSVSLFQEIFWAHVIMRYTETQLPASRIAAARTWVDDIRQFAQENADKTMMEPSK